MFLLLTADSRLLTANSPIPFKREGVCKAEMPLEVFFDRTEEVSIPFKREGVCKGGALEGGP